MKNSIWAVLAVSLALWVGSEQALADPFEIANSQTIKFQSEKIGEELAVSVSLPFGYGRGERQYPLVIVLDGDVAFGMASEIPRLMSFEASMPPVVVASVVYGDFGSWLKKRQRDYNSKDGGAAAYLAALKAEILPMIASKFRVNAKDVTLYGHSSGGLFALYAAAEEPALFSRVLASSPSVEEDADWSEAIVKKATKSAKHLPKIYMSIGGMEEKTLKALEPIAANLKYKLKKGRFLFNTFEDHPHMAVMAPAYTSGMRWLFADE